MDFDFTLFHFINTSLSNPFLDWLAPILREKTTWIPLYIGLIAWLIFKYQSKAWVIILGAVLCVGAADSLSSSVIKPLVKRLRPCKDPRVVDENALITCGAGYSFPSSHAANHFALACFLGLTVFKFRPRIKLIGYLWAASIALSQVYVGVHFPVDVFVGAWIGIAIAYLVYFMLKRFINKIQFA